MMMMMMMMGNVACASSLIDRSIACPDARGSDSILASQPPLPVAWVAGHPLLPPRYDTFGFWIVCIMHPLHAQRVQTPICLLFLFPFLGPAATNSKQQLSRITIRHRI
ncbi:hypothetical protein DFJ73DRAFT_885280, partial [Zopfochytrium polystomum]